MSETAKRFRDFKIAGKTHTLALTFEAEMYLERRAEYTLYEALGRAVAGKLPQSWAKAIVLDALKLCGEDTAIEDLTRLQLPEILTAAAEIIGGFYPPADEKEDVVKKNKTAAKG